VTRSLNVLFLLGLLMLLVSIPARSADRFAGRVVHVSDGDTVIVLTAERQEVKVRLYGVDSPESGQPFGQAAKRFTLSLAVNRQVTVIPMDQDRYGRTVGEVVLPDGTSLNRALVAAGYAWWYQRYAPRNADLQTLERTARIERRGLWADADSVPPWSWRKSRQDKAASEK
jgi:endonuclease YncB( thermonuclease family)